MATHREIETKFEVEDAFTVPDLSGVDGLGAVAAPVEHQLDAEYVDTTDHRLLRAGIALRRRTGGPDAGWHLKIAEVLGERIEVQRPLGRQAGTVPLALRRLVVAHVRDQPLAEVCHIRTRRTVHALLGPAGDILAELADDRVEADVHDEAPVVWREVEVELVAGDRRLLDRVGDALRDAGAAPSAAASKLGRALDATAAMERTPPIDRSSTAGEALRAYLREQAAALVAVDVAVRLDSDDAVHKMRVASRRLRSALATYRRLLDGDRAVRLNDELRWLGEVLGGVRDAEVIRDHLLDVLDEQPPTLVRGPVRRRVRRTLDADHRAAHRKAIGELSSSRYLGLLDELARVDELVTGKRIDRPARHVLATEVGRAHRRMVDRIADAMADHGGDDERFHEVRKSAKRARYAAESVVAVHGGAASKLASRVKDGQEVLGTFQDTVVVRDVLRRMAKAAEDAGEPTFTYGRLHAMEDERARHALTQFREMAGDGWADRPSWLR